MNFVERVHESYIHRRRVNALCQHLAELMPPKARVLDVGCGDGQLAHRLQEWRPDLEIHGVDSHVRPATRIPVKGFDGKTLPFPTAAFDVVMIVDVLHHSDDPDGLLVEVARVAKSAIIIKDHNLSGVLANATLRFMDHVGNSRHGVSLPFNYWTPKRWFEAFEQLHLWVVECKTDLRIYPQPLDWIFGRSLHFMARLEFASPPPSGPAPEVSKWEAAYLAFETPEQEVQKFIARLRKTGVSQCPKSSRVVEIFCGRGNGLRALARLGFNDIEGVDLSPSLVSRYRGPGHCRVGDCRSLPFADGSKDIVIVQGGLHHLLELPQDLEQTLAEVHRVLAVGGQLVLVEPWSTPFLDFVHWVCKLKVARRLFKKLDSMQTMIENEQRTYDQWLSSPQLILRYLDGPFDMTYRSVGWGKLMYRGRKKTQVR